METSASLLDRLAGRPDEADWRRLDALYRPYIRSWVLREPRCRGDADDLVQEVMVVLVRELPGFRRRQVGSFRSWLKAITVHRLQGHLRKAGRRAAVEERLDGRSLADELADPKSDLSRRWDDEHNKHVIRRLLELIQDDFKPRTLAAFRRVMFDQVETAQAAAELGMKAEDVLVAKCRVLKRLRQESRGFLDE